MGCGAVKAAARADAIEDIAGKIPEPKKSGTAGQEPQDGRPTTASTTAGDDEVTETLVEEVNPSAVRPTVLAQKKAGSKPGPSGAEALGKGAAPPAVTTSATPQQPRGGLKEESPIPGSIPSPKKAAEAPPRAAAAANAGSNPAPGAAWDSPAAAPPPSGSAPAEAVPRLPPQGPGAAPPPVSPKTKGGYAEATTQAGGAKRGPGAPSPGAPAREEVEIIDVSDEEDEGLDIFFPKTLDLATITKDQSKTDGGVVECIA